MLRPHIFPALFAILYLFGGAIGDGEDYDHDCYELTERDIDLYASSGDIDEEELCEAVPSRIYIGMSDNNFPGCMNCTCCQMKDCYSGDSYNYTGTWSMTASGRRCKPWVETSLENEDSLFPDDTVVDAYNYCRHTSNYEDRGLWCYTMNEDIPEDSCDIPQCDAVSPIDPVPVQATTTTDTSTISNMPDETLNQSTTPLRDTRPVESTTIQLSTGAKTAGKQACAVLVAVFSVVKFVGLPHL
ncbi:hepatocyte growth factor-like [Mercenaria mercenaria]|uniref:hepatocyte growth factor-like n=1 Tax=Mercenaria mercenaria TaxID=6596 RepID=UPI00234F0FE5|nr:hepatocyte growth factor-like [Mercenaria mercenaria]